MTVGGWYDAEDLFGPLEIYRATERMNPGITNVLVMGPWAHGDCAKRQFYRKGGSGSRTLGGLEKRAAPVVKTEAAGVSDPEVLG